MKIIISSNEVAHGLAYEFQTPSEVRHLATGDYSIDGAEHLISIERKTLNDLIGCLIEQSEKKKTGKKLVGRERFEAELQRSLSMDYFAVVVEAPLSDIIYGRYTSKMHPNAALQSLIAFSVRYGKLPFFFCGDRKNGQLVTESLLLKYAREVELKLEAMKKRG